MRYIQPISRAMSVRYVRPLTEQQRALLESTMKHDAAHRARMRAHGLLLSSEGITIKAIAKIYHVDRDTVSTWIEKNYLFGCKNRMVQPDSLNVGMNGLGLLLDVHHGLAVASGTPQRGHAAGIFPAKLSRTDSDINDGFIDQHLFTAGRAAIEIFLRRRAKRFVQGVRWERRVAFATHTFLSLWLRVPHG